MKRAQELKAETNDWAGFILSFVESCAKKFNYSEKIVKRVFGHTEPDFFAYSMNKTLIDLPVAELQKIKNLKVKYIQVDGNHKCIPWDSFLSLDNFAIYTLATLVMPTGATGFMNTYLRDRKSSNYKNIDFNVDFEYTGHALATEGWLSMIWIRSYLMWKCFKELFWLMLLVVTYAKTTRASILKIQTKSRQYSHRVETQIVNTAGDNIRYATPEFNDRTGQQYTAGIDPETVMRRV